MDHLDGDLMVSVLDTGGLRIETLWEKEVKAKYGDEYFELLMQVIEDNIIDTDEGEEAIDWAAVEKEGQNV